MLLCGGEVFQPGIADSRVLLTQLVQPEIQKPPITIPLLESRW